VLGEIYRHRTLVWAFAQRDFQTRYRSSVIGWAWSLVTPLAFIALFAVVFSVVFRVPAPPAGGTGQPIYVLFLFAAMVPWNAFLTTATHPMGVVRDVSSLLRKVHFPAFAPVLGSTLVNLVQVMLEFVALMIALAIGRNVSWTWIYAPLILVLVLVFAQGVGFVLAALNAKYGDIAQIVSIGFQALYFMTPILYPIEVIPDEGAGAVLRTVAVLNPLYWFISAMRTSVYELQPVSPLVLLLLLAFAVASFSFGWWVFQRRSQHFTEEL
jgi:ABC-type polysaccharide/polyol phosphate export permease